MDRGAGAAQRLPAPGGPRRAATGTAGNCGGTANGHPAAWMRTDEPARSRDAGRGRSTRRARSPTLASSPRVEHARVRSPPPACPVLRPIVPHPLPARPARQLGLVTESTCTLSRWPGTASSLLPSDCEARKRVSSRTGSRTRGRSLMHTVWSMAGGESAGRARRQREEGDLKRQGPSAKGSPGISLSAERSGIRESRCRTGRLARVPAMCAPGRPQLEAVPAAGQRARRPAGIGRLTSTQSAPHPRPGRTEGSVGCSWMTHVVATASRHQPRATSVVLSLEAEEESRQG